MSESARTNSEKINRLKSKIQKLESKESEKRKRRRRAIIYSDESDAEQGGNNTYSTPPQITENDQTCEAQMDKEDVPQSHVENTSTEMMECLSTMITAEDTSNATDTASPALDPELLAALGEYASDTPEFGPSVHDSLANIWPPLLKKGLPKEQKEKLLKQHAIPNNCKLLQAPKLNAEISAAVSEVVRGRDKKYVVVQQQLGQGIAAVNQAMDVMLKSDNKVEALTHLSDAGRILSDLHNFFTRDRVKLVTPSLDKNILHVIQDAERDKFLFGDSLSEKIKASKAIEKQGQLIKKTTTTSKPNTSNTTSARPSTSQGNWSGPPRYSSNRGGRGGSRKTNPASTTRRPYFNTNVQTKPTSTNKARAQAHH